MLIRARNQLNDKQLIACEDLLKQILQKKSVDRCDSLQKAEALFLYGTLRIENSEFIGARGLLVESRYILNSVTGHAPESLLKTITKIGNTYYQTGYTDSALVFYREAEVLIPHCKDSLAIFNLLLNISSTFSYIEQNSSSVDYAEKATIFLPSTDTMSIFRLEYLKGNAYYGLMDYERAERHYLRAFNHAKALRIKEKALPALNLLSVYLIGNNLSKAKKMIAVIEPEDLPPFDLIYYCRAQAEISDALHDWRAAYQWQKKAMNTARKELGELSFESGVSHLYIGRLLVVNRVLDSLMVGRQHIDHAISIFKLIGGNESVDLSQAYILMSQMNKLEGRNFWSMVYLDSALSALHSHIRNIPLNSKSLDYYEIRTLSDITHLELRSIQTDLLYEMTKTRMGARHREEILDQAYHVSQGAISLVSNLRRYIDYSGSKVLLAKSNLKLYQLATRISFDCYEFSGDVIYIEGHIRSSELLRSQLLKDHLKHREALHNASIPPNLLQKESLINDSINYYRSAIRNESSAEVQNQLKLKEFRFRLMKDSIIRYFSKEYPDYYSTRYATPSYRVEEIQRDLPLNSSLVSYSSDSEWLYALHISMKNVELFRRPLTEARAAIEVFLRQLHRNPVENQALWLPEEFASHAGSLYKLLLKPFNNKLEGHLLIIPSEELTQVPFESIVVSTDEPNAMTRSYQKLDYLINHHSVTYSYSVDFLSQSRKASYAQSGMLVLAPENFQGETAATDLYRLPNQKMEIRNLLLGNPNARILNGADANKQNFLKMYQGMRTLHFSTHTYISGIPEHSGIYFEGKYPDNLLTFNDISNLKWNIPGNVVLSTCNSGTGSPLSSEGIISLARAFSYAGAKTIVLTLWESNDLINASILSSYHSNRQIPAAIHQAKLRHLRTSDEILSHPYYWAGINTFVL